MYKTNLSILQRELNFIYILHRQNALYTYIYYVHGKIENSTPKSQINTVDYKNSTADFVNNTADYKNNSADLRIQCTVFYSSTQIPSFYFTVRKKVFRTNEPKPVCTTVKMLQFGGKSKKVLLIISTLKARTVTHYCFLF